MMGLREIESSLPPGFRFHPSDEELVCHYLNQKVSNQRGSVQVNVVEVDLHILEPWELPEIARLSANEWYFFTFRDRKYATGSRTNRATRSGYWKATGKDRIIHDPMSNMIVGMRKTLVFYHGRAPNGTKSGWVMHEFRLETPNSPPKEDWVLCRVFHKRSKEADDQMNSALMRPSQTGLNQDKSMPNASPDDEQIMNSSIKFPTISHQRLEDNTSSNLSYMNLAMQVQCNFLDIMAQDLENSIMPMMDDHDMIISSNCEDNQECRLFLDNDFDIQEQYCLASL